MLVLIGGKEACRRHVVTKSSVDSYLTSETIEADCIFCIIDVNTKEVQHYGDNFEDMLIVMGAIPSNDKKISKFMGCYE